MPAKEFTNGNHIVRFYPVQNKGKTLYQIAYWEGGVRRRHSFARAKKAEAEARIALTRLASPALASAKVTGPEMESYLLAQQHLQAFKIPVHVAAETFAEALSLVANGATATAGRVIEACQFFARHCPKAAVRKPILDEVPAFLKSRQQAGLTDRYVVQCETSLKHLGEIVKKGDLDFPPVEVLSDWLFKRYPHPVTRNTNLRILKVFSRWLVEMGRVPFDSFAKIKKAKVKAEPVVIYTPDEFRDVLARLQPRARVFAAMGAFSGLRRAEMMRLEWQDVSLERGYITVAADKAKTQARRLVPISPNLRRWLEPVAEKTGLVFELGNHRMGALFREAGVVDKKNALRHSYISYRLAEIQDMPKVALEAGNSPEVIVQYYRELVTPDDAKAWFCIMPAEIPEYQGEFVTRRGKRSR